VRIFKRPDFRFGSSSVAFHQLSVCLATSDLAKRAALLNATIGSVPVAALKAITTGQ
jgi:hypothetical protein